MTLNKKISHTCINLVYKTFLYIQNNPQNLDPFCKTEQGFGLFWWKKINNHMHLLHPGLTAFDHIVDFEEWIECGYFTEDVKARLKGKISCLVTTSQL